MTTEHPANELLYTAFKSLTPIPKHGGISEVAAINILSRSYAETPVPQSTKRYNQTNGPEDSRALGTLVSTDDTRPFSK